MLDWDGTVTERDTLDLVLEGFGDPEVYERVEAELEAGHDDAERGDLAAEFATVTAPLEDVVATGCSSTCASGPASPSWRAPGTGRGLSSGFHELIEPVLEREGVLDEVELRANSVEARPDGWRAHFRVRRSLRGLRRAVQARRSPERVEVVYAGDSHSDLCASLAADRVFATDGPRSLARRA